MVIGSLFTACQEEDEGRVAGAPNLEVVMKANGLAV